MTDLNGERILCQIIYYSIYIASFNIPATQRSKQYLPRSEVVVLPPSCVRLFVTPWSAACQASLSFTISWSLLKLMFIESVMLSNHLVLCHPLLLMPSIFPSIRVFSNELAFCIGWSKYWSFSISLSNEYSGLISFRIDWFDLLAVQGTLKSLLQHYSSKASVLWHSAFFMVQLAHHSPQAGWITSWNQNCWEKYQQSQICRWYLSNARKWRGTKEPLDEGERGSEKAVLKLSIQKTKIMASGLITSWQIDGEAMETVTYFIFLGSKITADGDCSHEIKRHLLLGRKAMTKT